MKKLKLLNKQTVNRNAAGKLRERRRSLEKSLNWDKFMDFSLNPKESTANGGDSFLSTSKLTSSSNTTSNSERSSLSGKSGERLSSGTVGETMILSSNQRGRKSTDSASSNRNITINADEVPQTSTIMLPEISSSEEDASTSSHESDESFLKKVSVLGNASGHSLSKPPNNKTHVIDSHYLMDEAGELSTKSGETLSSGSSVSASLNSTIDDDLQVFSADPLSVDDYTSHKKHLSLLRTPTKNRSLAEHLPLSPKSPNIISHRNQSKSSLPRVKPFTINDLSGGTMVDFGNSQHSTTKTLPLPMADNVLKNTSVAHDNDDFLHSGELQSNNIGTLSKTKKNLLNGSATEVPQLNSRPKSSFAGNNANYVDDLQPIDEQQNELPNKKPLSKKNRNNKITEDDAANRNSNEAQSSEPEPIISPPPIKRKRKTKVMGASEDDSVKKPRARAHKKKTVSDGANDDVVVVEDSQHKQTPTKRSVSPRSTITTYKNIITEILSPRRVLQIPIETLPVSQNKSNVSSTALQPNYANENAENFEDFELVFSDGSSNDNDLVISPTSVPAKKLKRNSRSGMPKIKKSREVKTGRETVVGTTNKRKRRHGNNNDQRSNHDSRALENENQVRRSGRHRVKPLRYWENEYIAYKRTEEGLVFNKIVKSKQNQFSLSERLLNKRSNEKMTSPKAVKHIEPTPFSIIDPNTSIQEHHYLVWPKQLININYKNITSKTPKLQTDTYLKYDNLSIGQVVLKPKAEKGLYLSKDHIIMHVLEGYGIVTIAKKQETISSGTSIIIPKENVYNIQNVSAKRCLRMLFVICEPN